MPGTVIDSLVILLDLDKTKYVQGQQAVEQSLKKTEDHGDRFSKALEVQGGKAAAAFKMIQSAAISLGVTLTASALKALVTDVTNTTAALGRNATELRMSAKELSAWEMAAQSFGAGAGAVTSSLREIKQEIFNFKTSGDIGSFFQMLGALHIDFTHGQTPVELLKSVADEFSKQGFDQATISDWLTKYGADPSLASFFKQGPAGMEKALNAARDRGPSPEDVKAFQDLQTAAINLAGSFAGLTRLILALHIGELTTQIQKLTAGLDAASNVVSGKFQDMWTDAFHLIRGDITKEEFDRRQRQRQTEEAGADPAKQARVTRGEAYGFREGVKMPQRGNLAQRALDFLRGFSQEEQEAQTDRIVELMGLGFTGPESAAIVTRELAHGGIGSEGNLGRTPRAPATTAAPSPSQSSVQQQMSETLASLGYSQEDQAAVIGNAYGETSLAPNPTDNPDHSGLLQWSETRRAQILAGTGIDVRTAGPADQMRAFHWEMTHTQTAAAAALAAAQGVRAKTKALYDVFEIPGPTDTSLPRRSDYAAGAAGATAAPGGRPQWATDALRATPSVDPHSTEGVLARLKAGAVPAGASVGTQSRNVTIGDITVQTASRDPDAVVGAINRAVRQNALVPLNNSGLA